MKKQKRQETKPKAQAAEGAGLWSLPWGYVLMALGALFAVFEVYGPSMRSPFVLDDLYLPYGAPNSPLSLSGWLSLQRPLLMFSYWVDYQIGGTEPHGYHITNVLLHFVVSVVTMFIAARLLEWAGVAGRVRTALAVFAGAIFLLHPLQTESVAYVASRSEVLSVLFYYSAFAVFIYSNRESMSVGRALAVVALFGAAAASKEHTLTLPVLLVLTDFFWGRGGLRKNGILYGLLTVVCAAGGVVVARVLLAANTAGFRMTDLSPASYFFTQCRMVWIYIRMFFLPFGQNVDPDIAISSTVMDQGAIFGLAAIVILIAAAWIYRKRWPLASFGIFVFLLLIAPTSSVIPIRDVLAERRVYLPFLGLILIALEFLRRLPYSQMVGVCVALVIACTALTYQRSEVWSSPMTLWGDAASKSPKKVRPLFHFAFAQYQEGDCASAAANYEKASRLEAPDYRLLVDWANALDCLGREDEAAKQYLRATTLFPRLGEAFVGLSAVYAKQRKFDQALETLAQAEALDPGIAQIYVNRGGVFEMQGRRAEAIAQYKRAAAVDPSNRLAREALKRMGE